MMRQEGEIPKAACTPIRALFIVPTLKRAGAETQIVELINRLDREQFTKTLVILEDAQDQLPKLKLSEIDFHCFAKRRFLDYKVIKAIGELIDKSEIDVIHATIQYSELIAWLACRLSRRKPKIVTALHTTKNVGFKDEIFDQVVFRYILRRSDLVLFVCHSQRDYWIHRFPEMKYNSTVVYNGVDPEVFRREKFKDQGDELRERLGVDKGKFVFACVASFRVEKGHLNLLEAFSKLPDNTYLWLAGDGPLRKIIEEKVAKLALHNRVQLLGNLVDVRPVLAGADIMVLPSTAETFSMAMLEALAMQVPVIASDIGGQREAITEGVNGSLVSSGDVEQLASKMKSYVGRNDLGVVGQACREVVLKKFTANGMTEDTAAIISSMILGAGNE